MTVAGIQFKNNDPGGYFEEKQITIQGIRKHYLFGNKSDVFNGQFSVEGYTVTSGENYFLDSIRIDKQLGGLIRYFDKAAWPDLRSHTFGWLYCGDFFNEFMIVTYVPVNENAGRFDYVDGIICAPATSRAEAVEVARRVFDKTGAEVWNDWNDWN